MELLLTLPTQQLTQYLKTNNWINPVEEVQSLEIPGLGNMNRVLRVKTHQGSLILKQAIPFVNKYPDIPAPVDRIAVEHQFYQAIESNEELLSFLPRIIGFDSKQYILAMEDLGNAIDFTRLYQLGQHLTVKETTDIASGLRLLHQFNFSIEQQRRFPKNFELRQLNHQHIFKFPLMEENGFDLDSVTPGLQPLARQYKTDKALKRRAKELGQIYLEQGTTLLHGDYYPGSWLLSNAGFKIIDPEFCFFGHQSFDLGVLLAHIKMAQQTEKTRKLLLDAYELNVDMELLNAFEGIEIIRRIIGLAQLPLELPLTTKEELLAYAYQKVMS